MAQRLNVTIRGPGPWGFRLAGGRDFNQPLYISKVTPGGKAHRVNILENDTILAINGQDVKLMTHLEAQNFIKGILGDLSFALERSAQATIWTPEVSQQEDQGFNVSLKANKQQFQHAGSSHNVKPRLFTGAAGGPTPVHKQFNSPVSIYSQQNIADSFKGQTEGLTSNTGYEPDMPPPPANWQKPGARTSEVAANPGAQSRSFRMVQQLAQDEQDYSAPSQSQPRQSADFRPSGTRSVRAPVVKPSSGGAKPANTLPVCNKCNRNIMGPFVKVRGNPLHDTCFTCESCALSLRNKEGDSSEEGFFVINEKLYCEDCKNRIQHQSGQVNGSSSRSPVPPVANAENVYQNGNSVEELPPPPEPVSFTPQVDSDWSEASHSSSSQLPDPPPFLTVHAPVTSHRDEDIPHGSNSDYQTTAPAANSGLNPVLASTPEPWNPNESYSAPVIRSVRAPAGKSFIRTPSPTNSNSKPPSKVAQAGRTTKTFSPVSAQDNDMAAPPPPPPPPTGHSNYAWRASQPAAPRPNPPPAAYKPGPPPGPKSQPPRAVFPQPPPAMARGGPPIAPKAPAAPSMVSRGPPAAPPAMNRGPLAPAPVRGGGGAAPIAPGLTRTPYCEGCNEPVRGTFVTAFGRNWHPEHFVCAHCHENLQGKGVIEDKGKIYCEDDYMRLYAPKCAKCRQAITGECVKAMGGEYHPSCFVCCVCQQPITGDGFHMQDGQTFCKRDFQARFRGVNCGGCNFPIEAGEAWLEALDKSYHAECFTCTQCSQRLEGQRFYAKGGRPYCQAHGS